MYKCEVCGITSQPRQPANKVVIETRPVRYPFRKEIQACWKFDDKGRYRYMKTNDAGGMGRECVKEVIVCPDCFEKLTSPL